MIKKDKLQSIIQKYYLGKLIESVKWSVKNNKLIIRFMSPTQDMLGQLECPEFQLEDVDFAVYDTTQLNKLLQVTSGELELKLTKTGKVISKLHIADLHFDLTYSLADIMLIPKVAEVDEQNNYEIKLDLDEDNIQSLIKAKTALIDGDNFIIESSLDNQGNNVILFTFGDDTEYANKVTYSIQTDSQFSLGKIPFNSVHLKEILVANKDLDKGKIFINKEGLMKLMFEKDGFKTEYYMVRKPEL